MISRVARCAGMLIVRKSEYAMTCYGVVCDDICYDIIPYCIVQAVVGVPSQVCPAVSESSAFSARFDNMLN